MDHCNDWLAAAYGRRRVPPENKRISARRRDKAAQLFNIGGTNPRKVCRVTAYAAAARDVEPIRRKKSPKKSPAV
jgi:hypothetical protein